MQANTNNEPMGISKKLILLIATAVAATAANLYYNQPVLPLIGQDLALSDLLLGAIPAATQLGYAVALLLISPLGDRFPRRNVIAVLSVILSITTFTAALSQTAYVLIIACFVMGLSANITQQLIPFAASLSSAKHKAQVMGTVMTGLTMGILISRTISGSIGEHFGWRAVFIMSGVIAILFGVLLYRYLPNNKPANSLPYLKLIASMGGLIKQHKVLRQSALIGALWFAAFNAMWATLALHVSQPPFNYDAQQIGLFGIIAMSGIIGAKVSGKWVPKFGSNRILIVSMLLIILGFIVAALFANRLWGLTLGIILIDLGVFSGQVANQVRIFSIDPAAQSRINAVYMLFYYSGATIGSALGVKIISHFNWFSVCLFCAVITGIGLLYHCMKRS
ncbi:MFS transporter [Marinomonas pollencensis]|uniref:Putative MFS family arabinose efflux permease n=1 Tax=Marinomonas pollencensis TaxID=491954 RepID=A0A3E0DKD1_9GAMM|nr:MFS transporter [Marinomonas pollencensis]REG83214.1 putative MFS family arabinose efflux permease [Marinomonas pollencensis]